MEHFSKSWGSIIPVHGKNHLINALAIANEFELPFFVVFDCDGDTPEDDPARPTGRRAQHERENRAIFALTGRHGQAPFPPDTLIFENCAAWSTKMGDVVKNDIGSGNLDAAKNTVRIRYGINIGGMEKNGFFIGYTMAESWENGHRSTALSALCDQIVKTGTKAKTPSTVNPVPAPEIS